MKLILALVLFCAVCATALPPDVEGVEDLTKVLENEPAAASRFTEVRTTPDVITFRDDGSSSAAPSLTDSSESSESSEYDAQIAQVDDELKRVKDEMKQTEECSRRLSKQKAQIVNLQEQLDSLQKEKEKTILQAKLDKQMRDLSEINRMSRALKTKFQELKRTQQMIKQKLTGTKSSLNQLDGQIELTTTDIHESAAALVGEVNAMHKAQSGLLDQSHQANSAAVKSNIDTADSIALTPSSSSSSSQSSGSGI